jgi:hypothetical protein
MFLTSSIAEGAEDQQQYTAVPFLPGWPLHVCHRYYPGADAGDWSQVLEGWIVGSMGTAQDPCSRAAKGRPKHHNTTHCGQDREGCGAAAREGRQLRQVVSAEPLAFYQQPCEDASLYVGNASSCSVLQVSPGSKGVAPSRCPGGSATAGDYDTCWIHAQEAVGTLAGWVVVNRGSQGALCNPLPGAVPVSNASLANAPAKQCLGKS